MLRRFLEVAMPQITVTVVDAEVLAAVVRVLEGKQLPRPKDAYLAARLMEAVLVPPVVIVG